MEQLIGLSGLVEETGFSGFWAMDSMGRKQAKLEPLTLLSVVASVTKRIEIGTCILQVPLRNPVELAHRARSLDVLSGKRFRFGVGPGSTKADFDLTGCNFENRHGIFREALNTMHSIWRGEPNNGAVLEPWPGFQDRPALFLSAWRNERAIERAAKTADGWIASGLASSMEELQPAIECYRAAGGRRALLANVPIDIGPDPEITPFAAHAEISLIGTPSAARDKLQRLEDLGFDDVLLVCSRADRKHLEAIRNLVAA
jgi:alkanesulfonate monooxygenase SsuD/methylene tetrahydromethanopterin reductase-like flavin-dependent oxidoreductase (luciferase family)